MRALKLAKQLESAGTPDKAEELSARFMIGQEELTEKKIPPLPEDKNFAIKFEADLISNPLLVVGWSGSEPYLKETINETLRDQLETSVIEELTIVDLKLQDSHKEICGIYCLSNENAFFKVDNHVGGFDTNELFLWLQSIYTLDALEKHADIQLKPVIAALRAECVPGETNRRIISWADDFMPAWVRFCWRGEVMRCAGFEPYEINLELEDDHVPLEGISGIFRDDIEAASIILAGLKATEIDWSFDKFPGAFFDDTNGRAVLPIPTWGDINELSGLKPFLRALRRNSGYVSKLEILPVPSTLGAPPIAPDKASQIKEAVARFMRVSAFASASSIEIAADIPLDGSGHA